MPACTTRPTLAPPALHRRLLAAGFAPCMAHAVQHGTRTYALCPVYRPDTTAALRHNPTWRTPHAPGAWHNLAVLPCGKVVGITLPVGAAPALAQATVTL